MSCLKLCFINCGTDYAWADWGGWSGCSSSTGFKVYGKKNEVKCGRRGIREKSRYCHDVNYCFAKTTIPKGTCLHGNESTSESCAGDPCVGEWKFGLIYHNLSLQVMDILCETGMRYNQPLLKCLK